MKKSRLRSLARQKGDAAILAAAQGSKRENMTDEEAAEVRSLYMEVLELPNLSKVTLDEFMDVLRADTLFERFAARKANQVGATKEFMEIKGAKF
jgi:hypothetical protein|tara:strand:- start:418 stop:702 length:285 start_codon:yes stop_codon:yes gene_type:complete